MSSVAIIGAGLITLAPPLVAARSSPHFPDLAFPPPILEAFQQSWTPIPIMDNSAIDLRKRLSQNMFCGHLLPAKVLDYIKAHDLYRN